MSSEELIQRARYGLDTEVPAPADSPASLPPEAPPVREPRPAEPFPGEVPLPPGSDPYGRQPEPAQPPYDHTAPPSQLPPPRAPRSGPRALQRFGGWILVGVLALGGFAWRAFSDTKPVEDLTVGECINEPDEEIITNIKTVDCAELHDYEVFQSVSVPYTNEAPYPGDEELFWESLDICVGYFAGFVGMEYADSVYDINAIYPTQESWEDQDDRETTCLIAQYSSAGEILQVTGTLRNARR